MEIIRCLNLCDCMEYFLDQMKDSKLLEYDRYYIGSYFCSHYFSTMNIEMLMRLIMNCGEWKGKMTLVIPTITEKNVDSMEKQVKELLDQYPEYIDEITVNDFGILELLYGKVNAKINLGRLFSKDYREQRYKEYFEQTCKPKIINDYMKRIVENYHIKGMEFDCTHQSLDFSEVRDLFGEITIGIHTPWCYQTVGQICEYGSVHLPDDHKFRPNGTCHKECMTFITSYMDQDENQWCHVGRAIYFLNETCNIKGIDQYRTIEWPLDVKRK